MVSVIVSRFSSSHFFRCLKPPQIWPVTEYHAYSPNDTVNRVFSHHPVAADISMFFTVLFALSLAGFWKKVDDYCSVLYHPVIRKSLQWYIVILYKTQNFWIYRVLRFYIRLLPEPSHSAENQITAGNDRQSHLQTKGAEHPAPTDIPHQTTVRKECVTFMWWGTSHGYAFGQKKNACI